MRQRAIVGRSLLWMGSACLIAWNDTAAAEFTFRFNFDQGVAGDAIIRLHTAPRTGETAPGKDEKQRTTEACICLSDTGIIIPLENVELARGQYPKRFRSVVLIGPPPSSSTTQ